MKQAINFLKYDYAKAYKKATDGASLDNLVAAIRDAGAFPENLPITLVPPPFLKTEVLFSDSKTKNSTLSGLSSGEKQKVYATSSMIYHLRYLDSVDLKPDDGIRHKYKYVNFIFDEIELYFHPEFQRTYVQNFRTVVAQAQVKSIKAINCIFITHSPFILSDIPSENVLILQVKEQIVEREKKAAKEKVAIPSRPISNTLGANIHTLLATSMFLDSMIGAFAEEKIHDILNFISSLEKGEKPKATSKIQDRKTALQYIDLIGEPLIKKELERMLDRARIGSLESRVSLLEEKDSAKGGKNA